MNKKYYVYIDTPCGTDLLGTGTKKECEEIKVKKDIEWRPGYMWSTRISSKEEKINYYCD